MTACPICGKRLHEKERVTARHVPASVPEHAERSYSVTRSYTLVECSNGHRMKASGGKGPLGWRSLVSTKDAGVWE